MFRGRPARMAIIAAVALALLVPAGANAAGPSTFTLYAGIGAPAPASAPAPTAWLLRSDSDPMQAWASPDELRINAGPPDARWLVTIRPPWGSALAPGTFRTRDSPHPPEGSGGLRLSGPRDCWSAGWVDIEELEFAPDQTVSRLRLQFECGGMFGEVRIGVDPTSATARVQPRRIRWPIVERERRGLAVPVIVSQETGSAAVGSPTVTGPQAGAFPIVDDECAGETLAAGEECAIWIEPDPNAVGPHAAELRVPVGATTLTTRLDVEEAGRTRLLVRARDDGTVTGGGDWWLDPSDSVFDVATWWTGQARFRVTPLDGTNDDWNFELETAGNEPLAEGATYPISHVTRDLRVTSGGAECWADGTLKIHELRPDIWQRFAALSAELSLSCGGVPAMDVLLEYRATHSEPAFAATFPFATAWTWGAPEPAPDEPEPEPDPGPEPAAPSAPAARPPVPSRPARRPPAPRPVNVPGASPAPVAARPATAVRSCQRDAGRRLRLRVGTTRADRLQGTAGGDRLLGRAGNDRLQGAGGGDCLDGGPGIDRLLGSAGSDLLIGGAGNDSLDGGPGDDVIIGGPGRDVVRCGSGRDVAVVERGDRVSGCERVTRP